MARSKTAVLVVLGSVLFAIIGTTPHALFAFRGVRPFWSRFESIGLEWIVPHLPKVAMQSVPLAVALFVIGEIEVHALRIVLATSEAIVLLQAKVGCVVAVAG